MTLDNNSANTRMNNLFERLGIGLLVLMLGWGQVQYSNDKAETREEVKELNIKVLELYRSSVTKEELKDLENRLTANVTGIRSDVRQILQLYLDQEKK